MTKDQAAKVAAADYAFGVKTAAKYAAEFKARKAALRARVAHNALNGIVTAGERAILDQERAENAMGEATQ